MRSLLGRVIPLSFSDVAMALGDPLQTVALARLPDPQVSLAALGVVKAIANLLESPIIMVLHASTALARGLASRAALWRFVLLAGSVLSGLFLLLCWEPVYGLLMGRVFGASGEVSAAARVAFLLLVPWPFVIAWRRFFQGVMIYEGRGRMLAWAATGRLAWVAAALAGGVWMQWSGTFVAALALVGGVTLEAVLATLFARSDAPPPAEAPALPSTLGGVTRFYAPLAATMLVMWGGRAALVSVVAHAADGTAALAAWAAAWGFVVLVSNAGRMVVQIVIATEDAPAGLLVRFALVVGAALSAVLVLLAFTPPGEGLLLRLLANDAPLTLSTLPVLRICAMFPIIVALQNTAHGFLVRRHDNWSVNFATVCGTVCVLSIAALLTRQGFSGADAAAVGMMAGTSIEVCVLATRAVRR